MTSPLFTVMTCAYNRPETLGRLYASLSQQDFKKFVWLIMDDSTTDDVEHVVRGWIAQGNLKIDYHRCIHRGKHWAQKHGHDLVKTPYIVDVDDDDELTKDCLAVLYRTWNDIEEGGNKDIGMVAALSVDEKGNHICYEGWQHEYIDTNYVTMEWTLHHPSENLISRRREVIQQAEVYRDDGKWLYPQVTLVTESVLWNRVAEKYRTRYLKKVLRIFHQETANRQSHYAFDRQKCINYTFSNYVLLNEFKGRYHENVKDTLKYLAEYVACGIALKYPIAKLVSSLNSRILRVGGILLFPAAFLVGGYFRTHYFK